MTENKGITQNTCYHFGFLNSKTMNIYALNGHKVKCKTLSGGYSYHQEIAEKYLKIDEEYTIEKTEVDSWHTDVWLQELPNVKFNSVFFEDSIEQSEEMDKKHPDYSRFH